jgi:hypothetical protein
MTAATPGHRHLHRSLKAGDMVTQLLMKVDGDQTQATTQATTRSSTRFFLRNSTPGSDDTLSMASRPQSTHFSPDTTPDGRTRHPKPWTPYTYRTHTSARKRIGATPRGPYYPTSSKKLQHSGAVATVIAPKWTGKLWHHALTEMASEELIPAPRSNLFHSGRRALRGTTHSPH